MAEGSPPRPTSDPVVAAQLPPDKREVLNWRLAVSEIDLVLGRMLPGAITGRGRRLVMRGFLGYLVPADPFAHFRPGLPAQALRSGLDSFAQRSELLDSGMLPARRNQPLAITAGQGGDAVQIQGDGPPPAPVVPDDRADPAKPDRARLVSFPDRVGRTQVQHVLCVLLVQ